MKLTGTEQIIVDLINLNNGLTYKDLVVGLFGQFNTGKRSSVKVIMCRLRQKLRSDGVDFADSGRKRRPIKFYPVKEVL